MSFDVKSDIMKAINGTNDQAMRTVFMLMLAVFESVNDKLDKVLEGEDGVRKSVLSPHEKGHNQHHEWVERRIKREPEIAAIVAWARKSMKQEEEDEQSGRKIRDGVFEKLIAAVVIGIFGFVVGRGGF